MRPARFLLTLALLGPIAVAQQLPPPASRQIDFSADIQPIFSERCIGCHGHAQQFNGLRLDRKADALAGGHSGPVILPGDSANSRLIHMVAGYQVKAVMPPGGEPLPATQIGLLRAWIDQGAPWPDSDVPVAAAESKPVHWAFQPRANPEPPAVSDASWVRNPIDRFVLARLEQQALKPSPEADRTTLLRRLSLDLTGLPPSPEELDRFLSDSSPKAYERTVDRLLRSDHYGEKWAMHWLDQVRYADSDGYEKDNVRPHAWRYRHWVINALNSDMGFDRFTIEQIAADLLDNPSAEQLVATGFHRNTLRNREGGVNFEQFRFEENVDRLNTVATVWLGVTLACSQCHDHKFDPFTQQDYYRFFAFFNSLEDDLRPAPLAGEVGPYLRTHDEYRRKRDQLLADYGVTELQPPWEEKVIHHGKNPGLDTAWDVNWDTLAKMTDGGDRFIFIPADQRSELERDVVTDYFIRFYTQVVSSDRYKQLGWAELREKLLELEHSYPQLSQARVVFERHRATHIQIRGQWDRPGREVSPGVPTVLPQIDAANPNRLDLARWLVDPDNPLTARVIVNRVWHEYFGRGLVSTTDDFGSQGDRPSHPQLLDWLADDFIRSGWSLKHLHRLIISSAAYRQSSDVREDLTELDPDNRLLARQRRLRLPAELIRDSALAASGLLYDAVGGPSVHPPQPESVSKLVYGAGSEWTEEQGPERYRRGLYIHFQRMAPYPFLMTFDAAERNMAKCTRERSNTPLQALNLLNDPAFMEAAQGLAARTLLETPSAEFPDRLDYAYRLCLARDPSPAEQARLESYFRDQKRLLDETPDSPEQWFPTALAGFDRTEIAAWVGLSRVLLNLDEFITRE